MFMSYLGAKEQADAAEDAARNQVELGQQALNVYRQEQDKAREIMSPYVGYGLMGMERMVGSTPMSRTMGGTAQQLMRQQQPTLAQTTAQLFGPGFNEQLFGALLGLDKEQSLGEWLINKIKEKRGVQPKEDDWESPFRGLFKGKGGSKTTSSPTQRESATRNLLAGNFAALGNRQYGGPVKGGLPYVVGEAGPEVMVPKTSGTVLPNLAGNMVSAAGNQGMAANRYYGIPERGQNFKNLLGSALLNKWAGGGPAAGGGGDLTQREQFMNNLRGSPLYMISEPIQKLTDWWANARQEPTANQPGILEQGPPEVAPMPTRQPFDFSAYEQSPWYQQPFQQGIKAIERSAIGQGGLYSGATAEALNQFGQDYAYSKYMPARQQELAESESDFNRWLQSGQFDLNRWLQGTLYPTQEMIRVGQASAANQAMNALQGGTSQANLLQNIGSAMGSGALGAGSAYGNLFGGLGNLLGGAAGTAGGLGLGKLFGFI